ncbi:MAG: Rid family detoxifying hydrolase [Oxalobacteraceae bacterium]
MTEGVAPALGPYSHAIADDHYLFCSGQLPIRPDGTLVDSGIADQVHRVFENIARVLDAGGSSLHGVIKATVFMSDLSEFAEMNRIYKGYFGSHHPARTTVQVAKLPLGATVEIDVIAKIFTSAR